MKYELRPKTSIPTFFSSDSQNDKAVISFTVDTVGQNVNIKALNAGNCTLTGMVPGIGTVTVNISVTYNPYLKNLSKQPQIPVSMYDEGTAGYNKTKNTATVSFKCYPPIYYVKVEAKNLEDNGYAHVSYNMTHESSDEGKAGVGVITVQAFREFNQDDKFAITVRQYKDSECKIPASDKPLYYYPSARYVDSDGNREVGYKIFFKKNLGDFTLPLSERQQKSSYISVQGDGKPMLLLVDGTNKTSKVKVSGKDKCTIQYDKSIRMKWGDGESHMIVFQPLHKGQTFRDLKIEVIGGNDIFPTNSSGVESVGFYPDSFHEDKGIYTSVVKTGGDIGFNCDISADENSVCWPEKSNDNFYPRFKYQKTEVDVGEKIIDFDPFWYFREEGNNSYGYAANGKGQGNKSGAPDEIAVLFGPGNIPLSIGSDDCDIAWPDDYGQLYYKYSDIESHEYTYDQYGHVVSDKHYRNDELYNRVLKHNNGWGEDTKLGYFESFAYLSTWWNNKLCHGDYIFYGIRNLGDGDKYNFFFNLLWSDTDNYAHEDKRYPFNDHIVDFVWYDAHLVLFSRFNAEKGKNKPSPCGDVMEVKVCKNPVITHNDKYWYEYPKENYSCHFEWEPYDSKLRVGWDSYYKYPEWIKSGYASCWPSENESERHLKRNSNSKLDKDLQISFTDEFSGETYVYIIPVTLSIRDCYALFESVGDVRCEEKALALKKLY